jgi:CBS-domain-containing membrane protein
MSSTVKDVMSTHVIAVRRSATYKEMAAMLHSQRVSAFPVIDEANKVIGIVSEGDLLAKEALEGTVPRTLETLTHQRVRAQVNALTAADLMSRPAITVGPGQPVSRAARLMYNFRVKRLPVISDEGTLIGIVTRSDVLSVYSRPDAEIAEEITQELILGKFRGDPDKFTVTVADGIVTIHGTPETTLVGRDIIDAVRHMEAVVAVRDRLSYPPDTPFRAEALLRHQAAVRHGAAAAGRARASRRAHFLRDRVIADERIRVIQPSQPPNSGAFFLNYDEPPSVSYSCLNMVVA